MGLGTRLPISGPIDVIIAARDAEATIGRAISSVLDQALLGRVWLVDDASSDATVKAAEAAASACPAKLEVVRLDVNVGPAGARNRALRQSTAPYFCVLDADDYMQPLRLARMAALFDDADLLADDILFERPPDPLVRRRNLCSVPDGGSQLVSAADFVASCISRRDKARGELAFIKPIVRREFIETHRISYRENLRLGEDYAFYLDCLLHGARLRLTAPCGYVAVERADSLSSAHSVDDLRRFLAYDDEVVRLDMPPDVRNALRLHRENTAHRYALRKILSDKRKRLYGDAIRTFLQSPGTAAYVARSVLKDKFGI